MEQQLELHYGEEYATVLKSTEVYLNTVLSRMPLITERDRILKTEGGFHQLELNALAYGVELGDFRRGCTAYALYLGDEYAGQENNSDTHHTKWVELDVLSDRDNTLRDNTLPYREGGHASLRGEASTLGVEHPSRYRRSQDVLWDFDEEELFGTMASIGASVRGGKLEYNPKLAAEILGWEWSDARRIYLRVKARVRRMFS